MNLSAKGLLLATAASVCNAGFDVSGKRALTGGAFLKTMFWIRLVVAMIFTMVVTSLWLRHESNLWLFRYGFAEIVSKGLLWKLLLCTLTVSVSILLYYRALQIAPLSQTIPIFGFTPVFILIVGRLFFSRAVPGRVVSGICFVVGGTLLLHWKRGSGTVFSAIRAFFGSKGVRYMLVCCLLLAFTNHLDQTLVAATDALSYAWLYSVLCALFASTFLFFERPREKVVQATRTWWIMGAGALDATVLLLQMSSLKYIDVAVAIALKRSGMVLSVLAGWLIFHERMGRQRLVSSLVVLSGALLLYFDVPVWGRWAMAGGAMLAVAYVTGTFVRRPATSTELER